uniref:MULE transposase domain-containing protein n=1 Tax=Fopius arisanus TaxID=64838 RepID=A0A0C9RDB7_9HYME
MFYHRRDLKPIEHEGYHYWIKSHGRGSKKYLVCKDRKGASRCKATAIMDSQGVITLRRTHDCIKDPDCILIYEFEEAIRAEIERDPHRYSRIIYDIVAMKYPRASILRPFIAVKRKMKIWRTKSVPPLPQSLDDYVNLFNKQPWNEKYASYAGGTITVTSIRGLGRSTSVVFADINYLRSLNIKNFHLDATFKVCPRRPQVLQLLTLMGRIDDTPIPIAWILMGSKNVGAYVAVLRWFKNIGAPHWIPETFTIDFEQALSSAILLTYPNTRIIRCFFHYCQCLTKYMNKCMGRREFRKLQNWPRGVLFFRKIMGLALLPATEITRAFEALLINTDEDIRCYFSKLITYYRRWWIQRVGPGKFSVYPYNNRTNNAIEAYHRVLGVRMSVHPSIWQFTEKLRQLQQLTQNQVLALNEGLSVTSPTFQSNLQSDIISRAWEMYDHDLLDNLKFLTAISHVLKAIGRKYLISCCQDLDIFRNVLTFDDIVHRFNIPRLFVLDEPIQIEGENMVLCVCM